MDKRLHSITKADYASWLFYLPRGIKRLEELGTKKSFPANHVLVEAGSHTSYCYVVLSGRVISSEYSESGEERIYSVHETESVLLEEALLFDYIVPVNIRTTMPTELICISREELIKAIRENPETALDIMQSMAIKLLSSAEQMKCMNEHSAMQKVCNLLSIFAERYGVEENGSIVIKEKLNQEYISSLLGLNRITVVRVMKELKEQGVLEKKNGYYCLYDIEGLNRNRLQTGA